MSTIKPRFVFWVSRRQAGVTEWSTSRRLSHSLKRCLTHLSMEDCDKAHAHHEQQSQSIPADPLPPDPEAPVTCAVPCEEAALVLSPLGSGELVEVFVVCLCPACTMLVGEQWCARSATGAARAGGCRGAEA